MYGIQAIMWPFTFFIRESDLFYKFYFQSWRYLGTMGQYTVDFFVICALLVAVINNDGSSNVSIGEIWGTFAGYIVFQGSVIGVQSHIMDRAMLNVEFKSFSTPEEPVIEFEDSFDLKTGDLFNF